MTRLGGAVLVLSACVAPVDPGALTVGSIAPASGPADVAVPVTITGTNFTRAIRSSVDDGTTSVGALAVTLDTVPLADGRVLDENVIEATIPAGLTPGTYDVQVQLGERSDVLVDAYTVEDPGGTTMPPPATPSPYAMTGLRWELPCITSDLVMRSCTCLPVNPVTLDLTGASTERWLVTARIRGVMEAMNYVAGTSNGTGWYAGGIPFDSNNNSYSLHISSPDRTYWLNEGTPTDLRSFAFDYTVMFVVDGNATITFTAAGQDIYQWGNYDENGNPITIASLPGIPQPYVGQFAHIEVLSAVPQ